MTKLIIKPGHIIIQLEKKFFFLYIIYSLFNAYKIAFVIFRLQ